MNDDYDDDSVNDLVVMQPTVNIRAVPDDDEFLDMVVLFGVVTNHREMLRRLCYWAGC